MMSRPTWGEQAIMQVRKWTWWSQWGKLCRESYSVETRSQWAGKDEVVLVLLLLLLLLLLLDETGTTRDYRRENV